MAKAKKSAKPKTTSNYSHHLNTVTPFSKMLALSVFIAAPVLAFAIGMKYQKTLSYNQANYDVPMQQTSPSTSDRKEIINYTIQKGDTLKTLSTKFSISEDTIKWANNIKSDPLRVGAIIKVLPVTGVAHIVKKGDTIYTLAKLYKVDAQVIVDYPFNNFPEGGSFDLTPGEVLIIPGGTK